LTLETARRVTDHGHPALIADLTHCLTIGDVIVCTVPGLPLIIECGGNPRFSHKGRKGRQRKRAEAVSQLLLDGQATFPTHRRPTRSLEVATAGDHSWEVLERVVMAAVGQGVASEFAADGDLIFALRTDDDVQLPEFGGRDAMTSPVVADLYAGLGTARPPSTALRGMGHLCRSSTTGLPGGHLRRPRR
jgi:hypothetical protein